MRVFLSTVAMLCFLFVALPEVAEAQDAKARAKALVDKGLKHQGQGRYEKALADFEAAYRILPHHGLRFNMGEACRLLKRHEQALSHYQTFVDLASLADQKKDKQRVDLAKRYIAELKKAIEDDKAAAAAKAAADKERARQLETERLRIEHEKLLAKTKQQQEELERLRLANQKEAQRLAEEKRARDEQEAFEKGQALQDARREELRKKLVAEKAAKEAKKKDSMGMTPARVATAPAPTPKPVVTSRPRRPARPSAYHRMHIRPQLLFGRPGHAEDDDVGGFGVGFRMVMDMSGLFDYRTYGKAQMFRKAFTFGFTGGAVDLPASLQTEDSEDNGSFMIGDFSYYTGIQLGPVGLFATVGVGFGSYDDDGDVDTDNNNLFLPVSASVEIAPFQYLSAGVRYQNYMLSDLSVSGVYLSGIIPFI